MLFRFFRILIYVYFSKAFVKKLYEKTMIFWNKFPKFISRCSVLQNTRMSNLVILKRRPFEYKIKFLKKRTAFPPHFVYDFSRKNVLLFYSTNWANFIVLLPLLLEVLGNRCSAVLCFAVWDVINFEIKLFF